MQLVLCQLMDSQAPCSNNMVTQVPRPKVLELLICSVNSVKATPVLFCNTKFYYLQTLPINNFFFVDFVLRMIFPHNLGIDQPFRFSVILVCTTTVKNCTFCPHSAFL